MIKIVSNRCAWSQGDVLMIRYHDEEWGVPVHQDQKLFEFMVLDAFQAGLSWKTILHRRAGFRKAFDGFNPQKIAGFSAQKIESLLQDTNIIRNRLKIQATIKNARLFLETQQEFGSFDRYLWQFTNWETVQTNRCANQPARATSFESDNMSKNLKKRGFSFVGSTICYAFMQAAGMVNDHHVGCFRHAALK